MNTVTYHGEKFYIQSSGKYYSSGDKEAHERLLHRRVWFDHNGPIPDGHVVHHKDANWKNNDISNLEIVQVSEHARHHKLERLADPEHAAKNMEWLNKAKIAAAHWHGSEAGTEWHRQDGKAKWARRQRKQYKCLVCEYEFLAYWPAKYCTSKCRHSFHNKKRH
jgi:hypothetical protein